MRFLKRNVNSQANELEVAPVDSDNRLRPYYYRDHLWLKWYEDEGERTYHSYAVIRKKWNSLSDNGRMSYDVLPNGRSGTDRVKTAIRRAKVERDGEEQ